MNIKLKNFKNILSMLIVIFFLVLLTQVCLVKAEQIITISITKDVSISITLEEISNYTNYTKFLKVMNLNDELNINDNLSMIVEINVSQDNKTETWNVSKIINSYSETGFGTLKIAEGKYSICAYIFPLNFNDSAIDNNLICKNLSTYISNNSDSNFSDSNFSQEFNESENNASNHNGSENITTNKEFCKCELTISTDKNLFLLGEKILFKINDCSENSKFNNSVEYWIEDSRGIVKQKINTTSKAEKTYTPFFELEEKYFLIKSKFQECENISETLVVFSNIVTDKNNYLELVVPEEEDSDTLYVEIKGFKGDTTKTLLSCWLEKNGKKYSSIAKIYVNKKNTEFDFKIPLILEVEYAGEYTVVVEGLDKREKEEINIVREKEDVSNLNQKASILNKKENNLASSEIISFYTLKKIFSESIQVYVNIKNPENKSLKIYTVNDISNFNNLSEKNSFNISISSENETIIAELFDKGKIISTKKIYLNLTLKNIFNQSANQTINKIINNSKQELLNEQEINFSNNLGVNLLANSTNNKMINFSHNSSYTLINNLNNYSQEIKHSDSDSSINFGFSLNSKIRNESKLNKLTGGVIGLSSDVLNKQNLLFVLPAIIICFLIFNRKARKFILEKTKFFK